MKKLKIFALSGFLIYILFTLVACQGGLSVPTNFSVDEANVLTWAEVENARGYVLEIKNADTDESVEESVRKASFSLATQAEGDYVIRIKAVGRNAETDQSEWSKPFSFHKDYETGCIYTLVNNSEYELTKVGSASGDVRVEAEYRGKPVTRIAKNAFKNSNRITSVTIGENVKSIGESAFYNCSNLVSVTLSDGLETIGSSAFQACRSLAEITITGNIAELPSFAFAYCKSLKTVTIGSGVLTIGESAFSDCSALETVAIPKTVTTIGAYAFAANDALKTVTIGSGVTEIGSYAFNKCYALRSISFEEDSALRSIGEFAFSECNEVTAVTLPNRLETIATGVFYASSALETVSVPNSVTAIGESAFADTKFHREAMEAETLVYAGDWIIDCPKSIKEELTAINLRELLKTEGSGSNKAEKPICELAEGTRGIAEGTFAECPKLQDIVLPGSIKYIGKRAFYKCPSLWRVDFHDKGVERIGEYAFAECKGLSTLRLNSGLKKIGAHAFYNATGIQSVTIPSTVESIGERAFKNTGMWNTSYFSSGIVYAGNWFVGCDASITSVALRKGTVGIADYAFFNCTDLVSVSAVASADSDNLKYIGKGAFYKCSSLKSIYLNEYVERIEDFAFYKCTSLLNIGTPVGLTSIGYSAFYRCEQLMELDLSGSAVETIGAKAFYGCNGLKTVKLGSDLKTLGAYAFYGCGSLKELSLPSKLTTVEEKTFAKCESLETVKFNNKIETVGKYAFQDCASLQSVSLPDTVTRIEDYAFYRCSGLQSLSFGNGLESIGDYAFYGAERLSALHFPKTLERIGRYAFKGNKALIAVHLSESVKLIDEHAFYGCANVTFYTDADKASAPWNEYWNSSYRPVVWNGTFATDEDGAEYVRLVTIGTDTLGNINNAYSAPERAGYTFLGWATNADSEEIAYEAAQLAQASEGTVLYAVWSKNAE